MAAKTRIHKDFSCNQSDKPCKECWQHVQSKEGISSIQKIMQNQNHFLKSMLIELLDEMKKSSVDKDASPCVENEKSSEAMKKELRKLQKENKKIKENLSEKQASLAKCLAVLENNNSEIDKLSKHIEDLCAERDKFREQLKRLQYVVNKKDATISSLKETNHKTSSIISEKEELSCEVNSLKEQLETLKKRSSNIQTINANNSEFPTATSDFSGLVERLQSVEKDLEASNLELLEYEEENRCYCQKIESLLKTIKCLQEDKLRSDEDNKEYFGRLNNMRKEFQDMYEEKNKTIDELNRKLQGIDHTGDDIKTAMAKKDLQIKNLNERLVCLHNEHKKCKLMETKYKDCQLQFEYYFKQIKALQKVLSETYSKLDICDKTIRDLEKRNKILEKKIAGLESSLDAKVHDIKHWEIMIKELHYVNLKLQKELRNKDNIITSLEECLDKSNEILENCEREMNVVEQRNSKFKREMCYIKSKLEGELLQNQCLSIKCNILNDNQNNSSANYNFEDVTKYKSQYENLFAEAAAKKHVLHHIKAELVQCFDKENHALSKARECCRPIRNFVSENPHFSRCQCKSKVSSKLDSTKKGEHRSRSKSPHKGTRQRCKSCPERKINYKHIQKVPSAPNFKKSRRKNTKSPTKRQTNSSYQSSFENSERLPKSVKSLIEYKNKKHEIRTVRSDGNLKTITIKIFNRAPDTCPSKCGCKCMTLITRRYKKDKPNKKYCKHYQ